MIIDTQSNPKVAVEKRIAKLRILQAKTRDIVVSLTDLYLADKPAQLKALSTAMKSVDSLRLEKVTHASKVIDACMNELTSLREGIFLGAVKKKDLKIVTCTEAITKFQELLSSAESRLERVTSEQAVEAGGAPIPMIDPTELVIVKNMKEAAKLPSLKDKLYVVGRAPVVVVTHSEQVSRKNNPAAFVDGNKLQQVGFSVDSLDGYAVIHNQLVLGVNTSRIQTHLEELNDLLTKETRTKNRAIRKEERDIRKRKGIEDDENFRPVKTSKPEKLSVADVADKLRQSLSKATKKRYVFVVPYRHAYALGSWFWLMTEPELNAFAKAFPGGHVRLNEFGFAF